MPSHISPGSIVPFPHVALPLLPAALHTHSPHWPEPHVVAPLDPSLQVQASVAPSVHAACVVLLLDASDPPHAIISSPPPMSGPRHLRIRFGKLMTLTSCRSALLLELVPENSSRKRGASIMKQFHNDTETVSQPVKEQNSVYHAARGSVNERSVSGPKNSIRSVLVLRHTEEPPSRRLRHCP